jgi:hypothetical protein
MWMWMMLWETVDDKRRVITLDGESCYVDLPVAKVRFVLVIVWDPLKNGPIRV